MSRLDPSRFSVAGLGRIYPNVAAAQPPAQDGDPAGVTPRLPVRVDLTGQRFGRLTALAPVARTARRKTVWLCQCDCGNTHRVTSDLLRRGETKSCGCLQHEPIHGHLVNGRKSNLYWRWEQMVARCTRPKSDSYHEYGARGVTVCERWRGRGGFAHFLADMGEPPPGAELHRIDGSRGYEPGNCEWISATDHHVLHARQRPRIQGRFAPYELQPGAVELERRLEFAADFERGWSDVEDES